MSDEKIAVVTAVAGDYDHPRDDRAFVDGVDYLFYTDQMSEHLVRAPWRHVALGEPYDDEPHPRRLAKGPKLNPHAFDELRDYRFVVWVDGGVHIRSTYFVDEIIEHLDGAPIVLSPHFDGRADAYGEATIRPEKYADEPLDEQVAEYRAVGYPGNTGLYECGVMARDMAHPDAERLGRHWANEVARWSYQDQVSLPFVLWALEVEPAVLPRSFRDEGWVAVNAHRRET